MSYISETILPYAYSIVASGYEKIIKRRTNCDEIIADPSTGKIKIFGSEASVNQSINMMQELLSENFGKINMSFPKPKPNVSDNFISPTHDTSTDSNFLSEFSCSNDGDYENTIGAWFKRHDSKKLLEKEGKLLKLVGETMRCRISYCPESSDQMSLFKITGSTHVKCLETREYLCRLVHSLEVSAPPRKKGRLCRGCFKMRFSRRRNRK